MSDLDHLNDNRVEKALIFLSSTDEDHAELSGEVKRLEERLKQVKAHLFLKSDGSVASREAEALRSPQYDEAVQEWIEAFKQFKMLDNKRLHEIRITEIYQTLSANRRKGSV